MNVVSRVEQDSTGHLTFNEKPLEIGESVEVHKDDRLFWGHLQHKRGSDGNIIPNVRVFWWFAGGWAQEVEPGWAVIRTEKPVNDRESARRLAQRRRR